MKKFIYVVLCFCLSSVFLGAQGQFEGDVVVKWIVEDGPDRRMQLIDPISYTDENGVVWAVPAGAVIDGASIPPLFWNTIGSPFVGDYRRASVVHDYHCDVKVNTWREVHRMFYYACLAGGVSKSKAMSMYAAVFAGGPRWELMRFTSEKGVGLSPFNVTTFERMRVYYPKTDIKRFNDSASWIQADELSLEDLEARLEDEQVFTVEEVSSGITM